MIVYIVWSWGWRFWFSSENWLRFQILFFSYLKFYEICYIDHPLKNTEKMFSNANMDVQFEYIHNSHKMQRNTTFRKYIKTLLFFYHIPTSSIHNNVVAIKIYHSINQVSKHTYMILCHSKRNKKLLTKMIEHRKTLSIFLFFSFWVVELFNNFTDQINSYCSSNS